MNDPRYGPLGYPGPQQPPERERTHPAVYLLIIAALCLVGGLVLVRNNEIEHNRQIQEGTDEIIDNMCAANPEDC